jgi:hypothetical protein
MPFKFKCLVQKIPMQLTDFWEVFLLVRRSGLTLDCGVPVPLWIQDKIQTAGRDTKTGQKDKAAQGRRTPKIAAQS